MRRSDCPEVSGTAAVVGHLIHPMLMAFSIAFLTSALATDLAFWGTGNPFWVRASAWLLLAGVVMGAIAAAVGVREFVIMSRVRSLTVGWLHFMGNAAAVLFALSNFLYRIGDDAGAGVVPLGIIRSAIVVAILLCTGWFGSEVVFRHRFGVIRGKIESK